MKEQTIFPREEHADVLFQKILADPWAVSYTHLDVYKRQPYWLMTDMPE